MRKNINAYGRAAYTLQQIHPSNPPLVGRAADGSLLVDPMNGHSIHWKVAATWEKAVDYLTGQTIPQCSTTLWLENFYGYGKGIHILVENYKTAFTTSNTSWIEKMEKVGLTEGLVLE